MRKIYAALLALAGLGAVTLVLVFVGPIILTYLAQEETGNTQDIVENMEMCSKLGIEITRIEETVQIRNTGSISLATATLKWENSTREYTENIDNLQPTSVKAFSTPDIEEASVSAPNCEKTLASYTRTEA